MLKSLPQDQVAWYLNNKIAPTCQSDLKADVIVIGGGMAGLSAAQAFCEKGKKVILLEQYFCGSGATGRSSGFVTPNAELSFTDFSLQYDSQTAHQIWDFISRGVQDIRKNILNYNLNCDYAPQDTLMLASTKADFKKLMIEYENLSRFGYKTRLYQSVDLRNRIGSQSYFGGVSYEDTFGIDGYRYCQALKEHLQKKGVLIFEETTVIKINNHNVHTSHAILTAELIVVCTDRFMPELDLLSQSVYHAQTFVMQSEELTQAQITAIFPQEKFLVWDTELVYNYFRITPQRRLLLGGGSVFNTYSKKPTHDSFYMFSKLTSYLNNNFPDLNIQFKQMWSGMMGLSKDIAPIAGRDQAHPFIYYITASAGLPIAAALGRYSAENLVDQRTDLDRYFSPYRKFAIGGKIQSILGKQLTFALCNAIKKNIP